eukprot:2480838-Alexandrium_andersonii.AAC.1
MRWSAEVLGQRGGAERASGLSGWSCGLELLSCSTQLLRTLLTVLRPPVRRHTLALLETQSGEKASALPMDRTVAAREGDR